MSSNESPGYGWGFLLFRLDEVSKAMTIAPAGLDDFLP